jgi:hypothetical protein
VKYVAVSGIADKDNNLIAAGTEFDDSVLTKEVKARFLKLKAIRKPETDETEDEGESGALTLENLKKMSVKDLQDLAKARNLEFDSKTTRDQLAQLVADNDLGNVG